MQSDRRRCGPDCMPSMFIPSAQESVLQLISKKALCTVAKKVMTQSEVNSTGKETEMRSNPRSFTSSSQTKERRYMKWVMA